MKRSSGRLAGVLSAGMLAAACGMAFAPAAIAQPAAEVAQAKSADLPITGITLYRSGVGLFQRRGLVDGQNTVQLRFATDQINDILKSLVVLVDAAKGRVQSVSYGSKDPLERRLASFGIDLSDQPDLGKMLTRLRGAPVRFTLPDAVVEGTIVSGEMREMPTGQNQKPLSVPIINVLTATGLRSINLTTMVSVDILDAQLRGELAKALAALAEHRADRVKTVDMTFAGDGAFPAMVAYVHEMPVWKTSYRLVLPEPTEKGEGGQPTIQGWALVENTTDEDWKDVRLSLVAGRPISFTMDLYEPLRVMRPELPVPTVAGAIPRVFQAAQEFAAAKAGRPASAAARGDARMEMQQRNFQNLNAPGSPAAAPTGGGRAPFEDSDEAGSGTMSPPEAAAQAAEVGEVFQYQLKEPVSLARQRSAMLPILSAASEGRRVSIFNRGDGSPYPLRGVELKNTTGLQLMPGPISVFDGSAYAGDAQIGHVSLGEKRLLAYAVDLDVRSIVKDEAASTLSSIVIVDGVLRTTFRERATTTYSFRASDGTRARTLLVEHVKPPANWTLISHKKPEAEADKNAAAGFLKEETQSLLRFELAVEPGKSATLPITFESTRLELSAIGNLSPEASLRIVTDGKASPEVVAAVKRAGELQTAVAQTRGELATLDQERKTIDEDQQRIRNNMNTVGQGSELWKRYSSKLADQETRLEKMATQRAELEATLRQREAALAEFLRTLNVN